MYIYNVITVTVREAVHVTHRVMLRVRGHRHSHSHSYKVAIATTTSSTAIIDWIARAARSAVAGLLDAGRR